MLFLKIEKKVSEKHATVSFLPIIVLRTMQTPSSWNYHWNTHVVITIRTYLKLGGCWNYPLCIFLSPSTVKCCKLPAYSVPMQYAWSYLQLKYYLLNLTFLKKLYIFMGVHKLSVFKNTGCHSQLP